MWVYTITPPESDTIMSPATGENADRQTQFGFAQKYSKGELEAVGSRELLDATSRGANFITGIVDVYAALDASGRKKLIDFSIQLVEEQREAS
jgi:hypothetical protein